MIISSITTFLFEALTISLWIPLSVDIIIHSIQMFSVTLIYLIFWCGIGLGIKLIFRNNILSLVICFIEQIFERYILQLYIPQLIMYSPFSLSKEIVIRQFPFWDTSSWASVDNTVAYANMSMIVDKHLKPVFVSYAWIISFLIIYMILIYLIPFIKFISTKGTNKYVT